MSLVSVALRPIRAYTWGALLALAYVVFGKLGLMLALPPGYATGVFPPAGIAVAATYLKGWRAVPWVFAGSLALNLWGSSGNQTLVSVLAALGIALASSLQAWVGGTLLRRAIGPGAALDSGAQVARYLLLAPIFCLVSASLSVWCLAALGVVGDGKLLSSWSMWWIGDTMGAIAAFPMTLSLVGVPRESWRRRWPILVSTMSLALTLVVVGYVKASKLESQKIVQDFQYQAIRTAELLQDRLDEQSFLLEQIDIHLSQHAKWAELSEFGDFVDPMLRRFPMIQALSWIPEIPRDSKIEFEASIGKAIPGFSIRERDDSGNLVPVGERSSYFPVTYIEPRAGNEKAIGFDLVSNPARRTAIELAMRTGKPVATEPLKLVQESGSQRGVLLARRVEKGHNSPGVVTSVLRMDDFVSSTIPANWRENFELSLLDIGAGIYLHGTDFAENGEAEHVQTLVFGGREYRLRIRPSSAFVADHRGLQSWGLLVFGILGTGLLGAILLLVTGSAARIQILVEERTRDLAEESLKNRTYLQSASDGVHILDEHGNVVEASLSFASMLGYEPEEVARLNVADWEAMIPPERLVGETRRLIHQSAAFETKHRRKDGSVFDVEISAKGIELGGRWLLYASSRDISERKRAEAAMAEAKLRAEAADRAKGQFLANMSHEIRTPMNAVLGMVQLLERETLEPRQRDYVEKIGNAGRSLLGILNDILDFSKIEADRLVLEHVEFEIADLVDEVATIMAFNGRTKELELAIVVDPAVPRRVVGDPTRLRQILVNLAGNAVKFTDSGRVVLEILSEGDRDGVSRLRFVVRDTGIGMTEEQLQRLFQMFTQADESTTRRFGGTGLGLAISKSLVERMGGMLEVESSPGEGSEFRFTLAFEVVPVGQTAEPGAGRGNASILVVDDDPVSGHATMSMAGVLGWRPELVASGEAALARIEEKAAKDGSIFDIVAIDWKMPGVDGIELGRRIRSRNLGARPQLILLASAFQREELAMDRGMDSILDGLLVKPVSPRSILEVRRAWEKRPLGSPPPEEPVRESLETEGRLRGLLILVAEDNLVNQEIVRGLLEMEGAKVHVVENGALAVDWLASHGDEVDGVLMDAQMPVMDGFEATAKIRSQLGLRDLPVIALSAGVMPSEREDCSHAGMDDFLPKPVEIGSLVRMLLQHVGRSRSGRTGS